VEPYATADGSQRGTSDAHVAFADPTVAAPGSHPPPSKTLRAGQQPSARGSQLSVKRQPSVPRSHRTPSLLAPPPGPGPPAVLKKLKSRDRIIEHRKPAAVFVAPPTSKMSENVAVYPTELKYVVAPPVVGSSAHQVSVFGDDHTGNWPVFPLFPVAENGIVL
jgi:hypothetical protein